MKAMQFTCPSCGWSITTPGGIEDVQKHVMMHRDEKHPEMQMTEEKFRSLVKEIDVPDVEKPKITTGGKIEQKEQTEAWRVQEEIGKRM